MYQAVQRRLRWPRIVWIGVVATAVVASVAVQAVTPPGGTRWANAITKLRFDTDEWQVVQFLRDETPPSAVILSNHYVDQVAFVFSGLAGRAAYLEAASNPVDQQALRMNPADDRRRRIESLWQVSDPARFCALLAPTGATHLVEYADRRLAVHDAPCLHRLWDSRARTAIVWAIGSCSNRQGRASRPPHP